MIRASYKQNWRGDWYDKGAVIPANNRQATRLVDCGRAYVSKEEFPAADKLRAGGVTDFAELKDMEDEEILNIEGIGPATLSKIRAYTDEDEGCGCHD